MAELSERPLRVVVDDLHSGATVVRVSGEVDLSTVGGLRAPLDELAGEGRDVTVDLGEVTFIDASGLGALVGARDALARAGHTLMLRSPSSCVERPSAAPGTWTITPAGLCTGAVLVRRGRET